MNDIKKAISHLTMLRRLDSGEKKKLYDVAIVSMEKQLNNRWISTSERLPERDMSYSLYVTIKCKETGYISSQKMLWRYKDFIWFNGKKLSDKYEVIAWIHELMPKPYKAD